jgi:hypothetical protein
MFFVVYRTPHIPSENGRELKCDSRAGLSVNSKARSPSSASLGVQDLGFLLHGPAMKLVDSRFSDRQNDLKTETCGRITLYPFLELDCAVHRDSFSYCRVLAVPLFS